MQSLPPSVSNALTAYAERLRQRLGGRVRDLRLFGSYARGDQHVESDIDVFVLVDVRDAITRTVPFEVAEEIFQRTETNLSPTVMDTAEWQHLRDRERRIARDIDEEGVRL